MLGKLPNQNQLHMFTPHLSTIVNPSHSLVLLAEKVPWAELEESFSGYYSTIGSPSKPIRLMVSLLLLKQLKNLSDEDVVKQWVQNPYYQYLSGESVFCWEVPCDPTDLIYFRKRIGREGAEKILELSIAIQPKGDQKYLCEEVLIDTSAQEKNITYPTDVKRYKKVIDHCVQIGKEEGIELRQTYRHTTKKLLLAQRFSNHPKNYKKARRAERKLKTIAGRLVRELGRKLVDQTLEKYADRLALYQRAVDQGKKDKNKLYSLHEPHVGCIAKGKAGKKYEYGSKVSLAVSKYSNIVLGVVNFTGNPHDSKTLAPTLNLVERLTGKRVKKAIVDRGYRGSKKIGTTEIISPKPQQKNSQKQAMRKRFKRRAAIEPIIGHVKQHFRMKRNYLKGELGDHINAILAGAAFNIKRWLNLTVASFFPTLKLV